MREPLPSDVEPTTAAPDAHVEAVRNEHRSELADALAALPAQQREAVLLRDVRGFSYEEVAASLAVSTSAVESLLFRARSRLRSQLRTAYAALSGAGWIGPLRELLGTGGLAGAPVAAKAVAVGALGAAVAGGVVAPTMLEHRGPAAPPPPTTRPAVQKHVVKQAPQASAPPVVFSSAAPASTAPPTLENVSAVIHRSAARSEGEHEGSGSDGAGSEGSGGDGTATESRSGSSSSGEQENGAAQVTAGSSEDSGGGSDGSSTRSGSGTPGGESERTASASSSEHSARTDNPAVPAPTRTSVVAPTTPTLSVRSEPSDGSGDGSSQTGSTGSGESDGGDGSDG